MRTLFNILLCSIISISTIAQTTIANGGFENWGNPSPGVAAEPTGWYSNKSGSAIAKLGPQTCFKDSTIVHSGRYSVKTVTENYIGTAVNGAVTTGVVNAPSISDKTLGYIGTVNYSTATDDRRMSFTGRPDSIVGWYQYTSGGTGEQGKMRAILHTGEYYDPETPTTYHPDPTANKIADALFLTPTSSVSTWTRFSIPFTYVSASSPAYIMINVTPSANQATTITGSTLWLDDLTVVYNPPAGICNTVMKEEDVTIYAYNKTVCVRFATEVVTGSIISLIDITGKEVFSQGIDKGYNSFYLSDLHSGIYIYHLSNSDFYKTGKLFIQ